MTDKEREELYQMGTVAMIINDCTVRYLNGEHESPYRTFVYIGTEIEDNQATLRRTLEKYIGAYQMYLDDKGRISQLDKSLFGALADMMLLTPYCKEYPQGKAWKQTFNMVAMMYDLYQDELKPTLIECVRKFKHSNVQPFDVGFIPWALNLVAGQEPKPNRIQPSFEDVVKFPYEELFEEIDHYIGWSQRICDERTRNCLSGAGWEECRNKLYGCKGFSKGILQKYKVTYLDYLCDIKNKGYSLAYGDEMVIRSLLDLIHLTHTADNGSTLYPFGKHYFWQSEPLDEAFSWLKIIYNIYPNECRMMMQEYKNVGKMIPDNIKVGYEEWATTILSSQSNANNEKHTANNGNLDDGKDSKVDKPIDEEQVEKTRERIKQNPRYKKRKTSGDYLDDNWCWHGSIEKLIKWLVGFKQGKYGYEYESPILRYNKGKKSNKANWLELDGVFTQINASGNYKGIVRNSELSQSYADMVHGDYPQIDNGWMKEDNQIQ